MDWIKIITFSCFCSCGVYTQEIKEQGKAHDGREIVKELSSENAWRYQEYTFDRSSVESSVELLRIYFLNNQDTKNALFRGNFSLKDADYYQDPSLITQTFGVAALAELATQRSNPKTREILVNTLGKLISYNQKIEQVSLIMPFNESHRTQLSVPAMIVSEIALFITEQKQYMTPESNEAFNKLLKAYMNTLESCTLPEGGWGRHLNKNGFVSKERDAFVDGACLLAYCRAFQQLKMEQVKKQLSEKIPELIKTHLFAEWQQNTDSMATANFATFGMIGLAEYSFSGEKDAELAGDAVLALAWWLIHTYQIETKTRNNGIFIAPLCAAWKVARARKLEPAEKRLQQAVEKLLFTAMAHQLGHEISELYLPLATSPYFPLTPEKIKGGMISHLGQKGSLNLGQNYWFLLGCLNYLKMTE